MTTKKAAIVGCSDPLPPREQVDVRLLPPLMESMGVAAEISPLLFTCSTDAQAKAAVLNDCFRDPDTDFIFDVSGGDLANTALPYLDFDAIKRSRALFFGFSDLTVIINAVIAKTGRPAVNYQLRNLLYSDAAAQRAFFTEKLLPLTFSPADLRPVFLRGGRMEGKIIGGNIRCFLKLAGTRYWPAPEGRILLLESLGGNVNQMITALEQYRQLGVFDKISGVLLGAFTKMRDENLTPTIEELVLDMTPPTLPVAKTALLGHDPNSRALLLGVKTAFARQ